MNVLDIFQFEFLYWPVIRLHFQLILDKTIPILPELDEQLSIHAADSFIPDWEFCVYMRKVRDFALFGVFLQDGAQEEQHSKTKQESAWLFRLWYTFDHKYPFSTRLCNTQSSVSHYVLRFMSQKSVAAAASPLGPFVSYKSPS